MGLEEKLSGPTEWSKRGCSTKICLVPGIGTESEEGPQKALCCRVGDRTPGLDMEDRKKS